MNSSTFENASYYFWKWADNDLPGRPTDVHAELLRGGLHPALQAFDARPLLTILENSAARWRRSGEDWDWQTSPHVEPRRAHFVHVTCPAFNSSQERVEWFGNIFLPLGLSGIDEEYGRLIPCLRPKLSQFIPLQFPEQTEYDIEPADLPVLLRKVVPGLADASAELLNRNGGVVAIATGRRFRVEWREYADWKKPTRFTQWRAQDPKRLDTTGGADHRESLPANRDPDLLRFSDTLRIFDAFLRGEPRPTKYCWPDITDLVS